MVFPAGAGVILSCKAFNSFVRSFPRRCGGDPLFREKWLFYSKFSPQVRGWSRGLLISLPFAKVFPAGAGVILIIFADNRAPFCFPRRCGGDPGWYILFFRAIMFSPQVRGWSRSENEARENGRVFPAGAGVILYGNRQMVARRKFSPQVRGWSWL